MHPPSPPYPSVLPLQASSELGSALFTVLVLALSAGLIGAIGGALIRRFEEPVGKYRVLYVAVLLPAAVGAYAFLTLAALGPSTAAWFALGSGFAADAFANFVEFLAAGVVWLTAYAPTIPNMRDDRELDRSATGVLKRMARYVLVASAVLAVVVTPFVGAGLPIPL